MTISVSVLNLFFSHYFILPLIFQRLNPNSVPLNFRGQPQHRFPCHGQQFYGQGQPWGPGPEQHGQIPPWIHGQGPYWIPRQPWHSGQGQPLYPGLNEQWYPGHDQQLFPGPGQDW